MEYFVENKEKIFERWDKLGFCKGLKGDLNEKVSKLYEYR